VYSW